MPSTEQFDELERRLSELVKDAVQQVKDEFKEKLRSTRDQVEEAVGKELHAAREAAAEAQAEAAQTAEAVAAAESRAQEAAEALSAAEARLAEMGEALQAADARAADSGGAVESAEARVAETVAELEAAQDRAAEASEAQAAAEARVQELTEALETAESRIAELDQAKEEADGRIAELSEALGEAERAAEEAASTQQGDLLDRVMETVRGVDQATSQAEVLEGLLTGAGDFAARTALFLTGADGLKGWGHRGFSGGNVDFEQLVIAYEEGSAQSRLAGGQGVVELDEEDCAALCQTIDGSRPQRGVLVPMVLANRLAAALYADQIDDHTFDVSALQLIAYATALALETLPLRENRPPLTLQRAADSQTAADMELWDFAPPVSEPEAPLAEDEVVETEPAADMDAAPDVEVTPDADAAVDIEPVELEEIEASDRVADAYEVGTIEVQEAEESGFAVEDAEEVEAAPETTEEAPAVEVDSMPEAERAAEEVASEEPDMEPVEAAEPEEEGDQQPEEPVSAPATEVAPPPPMAGDGAQVAPPDDLDGPGWAFQTRTVGGEGEDAAHEEARRLARLLVTEIKLYNEEQVEEGRRNRNIYQTLREDIDRSRQIYEERVDEGVRTGTDYFHDELVRILAAGETEVLGV